MDHFNILPAEIISDILIRLPAESVLEYMLISKTWRNLIQHPSFFKMHADRLINQSATAYSTDSGKVGFLALAANQQLHYFEYTENNETPIDRIRKIKLKPPFKCHSFAGSFNGLICFSDRKKSFFICNPMTKESVILPAPMRNSARYRWIGFGYLRSTNEYKVVLMCKQSNFVEVMVYTLGSGNGWRNIGKFKLKNNDVFEWNGIFVDGALHWMHRENRMILVFDLAQEKFCEHLSPPRLPTHNSLVLGFLGGFLSCAGEYSDADANQLFYDVWLYKKKKDSQDEHESLGWSKMFTAATCTPFALMKSGSVLCYSSSYLTVPRKSCSCLSNYDPKASTPKWQVYFKEEFVQVLPHKNTFVSLKELGEEEEGAKIMKSVELEKQKRLD